MKNLAYHKLRYSRFIYSRPTRTKSAHTNYHHIIPASVGGSNKKLNRIHLTHREHFIAHMMLTRCYEGIEREKMINALNFMKNRGEDFKITARTYHIIKRLHHPIASAISKRLWADPIYRAKALKGMKNRDLKKRMKHSEETLRKMSEAKKLRWADPTFKAMRQKQMKHLWKDPEYRAKQEARRDTITGQFA